MNELCNSSWLRVVIRDKQRDNLHCEDRVKRNSQIYSYTINIYIMTTLNIQYLY